MALSNGRLHAVPAAFFALAAASIFVGSLEARPYSAVEIRGAEFIPVDDIQAACDITPGAWSAADMALAEDCLISSGQFSKVALRGEGETLLVEVSELNNRPGRVELGLGYDSRDGLVGSLYFERYNLFPGTFGAIDLRFAKEVRSLQTALYRPDSFGPFDFGLDTQIRQTDYSDQGFATARTRIEPYLAMPFGKGSRVELGLGYRRDEMKEITPGSSALFPAEAGLVEAPYARLGLSYSLPAPKGEALPGQLTGLSLSLDHYIWGLGQDERSSETRIEADSRFALTSATSLLIGLRGGIVQAGGDHSTRAIDRFFIGGADFRGFAPRGLGPKDGDWFTGANKYYVASFELQRGFDELLGTSGRIGIFADIGSAWGLDNTLGGAIDDSKKIRSSVGLSLTLDLGEVPVSLFVAKPLDYESGDDRQSFGISFSTSF